MKKLGMHFGVVEVILLMLDYTSSLPMDEMIIKKMLYLKFLVREYLKKKKFLNKVIKNKEDNMESHKEALRSFH